MNTTCVVISDRGDTHLPRITQELSDLEIEFLLVDDRNHHLGLAGAVREAWRLALHTDCDYLLHIEEDFTFPAGIPVAEMVKVAERSPHLAQVVLKRQPWNDTEKQAGGIIEAAPHAYRQRLGFVEHTEIFSLNPCIIPRRVLELGWPDGNEAEFTIRLLDLGYRFAFFGYTADPPRCIHLGNERAAGWRL